MKQVLSVIFLIPMFLIGCAGKPFFHNGKQVKSKSTKIIAKSEKDDKSSFKKIKQLVVMDGYNILSSDEDSLSFLTNWKRVPEANHDVQIRTFVMNGKVTFQGECRMSAIVAGGIDITPFQIQLYGAEGSVARVVWNELYKIANLYSKELEFE